MTVAKANTFEQLAADAADRIAAAAKAGEQLTFLPDEPVEGGTRAPRGAGRATSQLRKWAAAKGYRMPEDVLTEIAGMASTEDAFVTALARTELVLAWAQAGALGYSAAPVAPSMVQRLATFQFVFTAQLRAAEALVGYGLAKVTPDVLIAAPVQLVMMGSGSDRSPERARDVTPRPGQIAPPPMPGSAPYEIQLNQGLAIRQDPHSDADIRTEGPSL